MSRDGGGGEILLVLRSQHLSAAHVGLEHGGDLHGAVGLQVVLQEGNEHAGRRHHGVVQGVGQVILPFSPLTRIFRRRAWASPRLEQEQTSKYFC